MLQASIWSVGIRHAYNNGKPWCWEMRWRSGLVRFCEEYLYEERNQV